ncbi:DUF7118 family protein [Halodesulfurarchaeum formicicum]|uniref:DUF7118 family protein n=1 Tax=Halodesulfurarchaeum formicicum TaxID=1873524 RepID=UPI000903B96C|nr:hypothetical protein [Halodesulfurarchaeum formicicum]
MTSTDDPMTVPDLVADLKAAREALAQAEAQVAEIGESRLRRLESAHEEFTTLLSTYEDRATGSGDFQAFVEFQDELAHFLDDYPEDLPERETFEAIDETLQKRRLTDADFEWARDRLGPVEDLLDRLTERHEAEQRVQTLAGEIRTAIRETRARIDRLETVKRLGTADLDAPVEDLRDPIERYNESVRAAIQRARSEMPARQVLSILETAERFPLLSVPAPPAELHSYLESAAVGTETIPTLLEYADYSQSKLAHYVDAPATFARVVGGNRTYLDTLDATPFEIEWPPPAADHLRFRGRELVSVLNRFDARDSIAALRDVLDLARGEPARYASLRKTARARTELTESERRQVADGTIEAELEAARDRLAALETALEADR